MCLSSTRKNGSRDPIKDVIRHEEKTEIYRKKEEEFGVITGWNFRPVPFLSPRVLPQSVFSHCPVVSVTIAAEWVKHIGGGCSRSCSWSSSVLSCWDACAGAAALVFFCSVSDLDTSVVSYIHLQNRSTVKDVDVSSNNAFLWEEQP